MQSPAVSFELSFPEMARRQLQATAVDPSSAAFQTELRAAVAASFGVGITADHVQVASTAAPRVLAVTVTNAGTTSMDALVAVANSAAFVSDIGARVGTGVAMHSAAAVVLITVSVPSPPPSPPTVPPPATPITVTVGAQSAAALTESSTGITSSSLIFVIVAAVVAVIVLGLCVAYLMGKRAARQKEVAVVGRPALRRQSTSEKSEQVAPTDVYAMDETVTSSARVDDVRLIELGMAVERTMQMQRQSSAGAGPSNIEDIDPTLTNMAVKAAIDNVQMALDEARESLSPRALRDRLSPRGLRSNSFLQPEGSTSPRPVDTGKIRETKEIDF